MSDLAQHEGYPDRLFLFKGEAVIFEGDGLLFDNIVCRRLDDPVVFLEELWASRISRVPDWMIDQAAGMLNYLGRERGAKRVLQLKLG